MTKSKCNWCQQPSLYTRPAQRTTVVSADPSQGPPTSVCTCRRSLKQPGLAGLPFR